MKRVLTLLALFGSLSVAVWLAVTTNWRERMDPPEPGIARATAESPGGEQLVGAGAFESQRELPALVPDASALERTGADRAPAATEGAANATVPTAPTVRVAAVALDYGGRPLAGRELALAWRPADDMVETPQPIVRASAAADGSVAFEVLPEERLRGPISLRVEDTQSGAWCWSGVVLLPERGELDLGTLHLTRPRELHPVALATGRVGDSRMAPIPGVVGFVSARNIFVGGDEPEEPTELWEGEVVIEANGHFAAYGPPTSKELNLLFAAQDYQEEDLYQIEVPTHGLEVSLAREIRLRGRLLVPEQGPPVTNYGVWLSEEGMGMGISPRADGNFSAIGSTRSIEVKVTQPGLGLVLFKEVFALSPEADGELGTIDVRDVVKPVDLVLVDSTGAAIANEVVWIEVKDVEPAASEPRGQAPTDANGRLFVAVPTLALEAKLTVSGRAPVVVDLVSPPPRIEVP